MCVCDIVELNIKFDCSISAFYNLHDFQINFIDNYNGEMLVINVEFCINFQHLYIDRINV